MADTMTRREVLKNVGYGLGAAGVATLGHPTVLRAATQPVKMGILVSLTGVHAIFGETMLHCAQFAQKEINDITTILSELRTNILAELRQPEIEQLQLAGFSTTEREQFERNMSALAARVEQIDTEIEQEHAAIRKRYANPQPRLFPVAVTYLIPEHMA